MSEKPTKITSTDFLDPLSADMRLTQQLVEQLPASRKQRRLKNKSAFLYVQFFQQCRKQMKNWLSSGFIFKEPEVILHPERWAEAEKFTLSLGPSLRMKYHFRLFEDKSTTKPIFHLLSTLLKANEKLA